MVFLSNLVPIERGCRQGDPIAPYLFLLVAEVLGCLIETSQEITGIKIGNNMYKLTQFANDTAIILDGTSKSFQATLNILEIFGDTSGLKINSEKTKLIWIRSKTGTKEKLSISQKLHWGELRFYLLGITFSCNLLEMPDLNYSQALGRANRT